MLPALTPHLRFVGAVFYRAWLSLAVLLARPSRSNGRAAAAYHGLARAVIRSSVDASGVVSDRMLRKLVYSDAGRGKMSASIFAGSAENGDAHAAVVLNACAEGPPCAGLSIPTSADPGASPFEAAARSVALADIGVLTS